MVIRAFQGVPGMTPAAIRATRVDDLAIMLGYDEEQIEPLRLTTVAPSREPVSRSKGGTNKGPKVRKLV